MVAARRRTKAIRCHCRQGPGRAGLCKWLVPFRHNWHCAWRPCQCGHVRGGSQRKTVGYFCLYPNCQDFAVWLVLAIPPFCMLFAASMWAWEFERHDVVQVLHNCTVNSCGVLAWLFHGHCRLAALASRKTPNAWESAKFSLLLAAAWNFGRCQDL